MRLSINNLIIMELKQILKNVGKSYTDEREIIFWVVKKIHHFDYSDLQNELKLKYIDIWRASIFRTLNLFVQIWILENICNKNWIITYEYIDEFNHHEHMKCQNCWKIIEFNDEEIHSFLENISIKNKFKLIKHSINLEWLCEGCDN